MAILGLIRGVWDGMAINFVENLLVSAAYVVAAAVRQIATPDELRGRVAATSSLVVAATRALSVAGAGLSIAALGSRLTLLLFGVVMGLAGCIVIAAPASRTRPFSEEGG